MDLDTLYNIMLRSVIFVQRQIHHTYNFCYTSMEKTIKPLMNTHQITTKTFLKTSRGLI
jgi:hypothetical protein